ncbi:MAG: tetratricopeptide repeat protein [Bacteroidota bacterium]
MRFIKRTAFLFLISAIAFGYAGHDAWAQTKKDAVESYNEAFKLAKAENYSEAITVYEETIQICEQLGTEGDEIRKKAEGKLPRLYFRKAAESYKAFKKEQSVSNLDAAIAGFKQTREVAEKYDDAEIANRSRSFIPTLYYTKSIVFYKQQMFEQAGEALDNAINANPNYAKAYYQKALVLKKQEKIDSAISMFDRAIQVAMTTNDSQMVEKAQEAARDELIYQAVNLSENKDFDEAIAKLERALEYDSESPNAHYRLAEIYNKQAKSDLAIEHANEALKYESGGKTDRAKIYFELGTALKRKGNKSGACDAFEQATFGSFKQPAEHEMEYELECDKVSQSK